MKIIIIVMMMSLVIGLPPQDLNYIDIEEYNHFIMDYLEYDLRDIMINKSPIIEKIPQIAIQYNDNKFLVNRANFNDLGIKNLSYYDIMYCDSDSDGNVIFGFYFPMIIANGFYDVNIRHLGELIIGQGQFNLSITDLRIQFKATIIVHPQRNFKRNSVHLKSLTLNIIPGIFKFIATNTYMENDQESKKWSNKVSKLMPIIIFDSHDFIEPFLSKLFIDYINN